MEKQLMDKIKNHTVDDVDKEMIEARIKAVHMALRKHLDIVQDELSDIADLCADKKDEVQLLNFRLCFAFDDNLIHGSGKIDGIPCMCTYGAKDELQKLVKGFQKVIDSH